jgi:hypothetical protein
VKERPILFSGPMVRAILDGQKTQTRRIVKPQPSIEGQEPHLVRCPYGVPGDRLWVRETWGEGGMTKPGDPASYAADWPDAGAIRKWRPSIHMPRWASRIDLEVTAVRVERLQAITEEDARAEGAAHRIARGGDLSGALEGETPIQHVAHFRDLWDSINGERTPWASNPWVWVVSFKRVRP